MDNKTLCAPFASPLRREKRSAVWMPLKFQRLFISLSRRWHRKGTEFVKYQFG